MEGAWKLLYDNFEISVGKGDVLVISPKPDGKFKLKNCDAIELDLECGWIWSVFKE